ncbi:MAG: hypothetical protein ACK2U0_11520 [Candidatus Promineifilaceae bacterium]
MKSSISCFGFERKIEETITGLDNWFDSTRSAGGYGGPVVHWWQDSLAYTGPSLDWRYEGIISGYLNLYQGTGDAHWLAKACRAGDDLVAGQLPSGNFRSSAFEINPLSGGTPHEAACDLALLRLARILKAEKDERWTCYAATAECNLQQFVLGILWDDQREIFQNTAYDASFVPNKAATIVEALLAWGEVTNDSTFLMIYVLPTLERIMKSQVRDSHSSKDGAIYQAISGAGPNERFFPYYIARCIPALVAGYTITDRNLYLESARSAINFILRYRLPDGSFPQVIYGNGKVNRYPQWIAATGDILWAMELLNQYGAAIDIEPTLRWLLQGRQPTGSIRTAFGFGSMVSQREPSPLPDFRDLIGVCGWNDKAFHYLTNHVISTMTRKKGDQNRKFAMPCCCFGKAAIFCENDRQIQIRTGQTTFFCWQKGASWAVISRS